MRRAISIFCFFIVQLGFGQENTLGYELYGTNDGLTSQEVYCILEDQNGYIWFGTDVGVSRFDGYEFTNFSIKDGLTNSLVFDIYEDYKGRLWFLSYGRSICYFENDSIYAYAYNPVLAAEQIEAGRIAEIHVDTNETVYFNFVHWGREAIDKEGNVVSMPPTMEGAIEHLIYLPSGEKVLFSYLQNGEFPSSIYYQWESNEPIYMGSFEFDSKIFSLSTNSDLCVFLAISNAYFIQKDTFLIKKLRPKLTAIEFDERDYLWLGTSNNGIKVYENITDLYTDKPPVISLLDGFNISEILMQKNGSVWFSIENKGLCHVYNYYVDNYEFKGDKLIEISALCKNAKDELFYGTSDGRIFFVDSSARHQLIFEGAREITELYFKDPGTLCFSVFNPEAKWYSNEGFKYEMEIIDGRGFCITDDANWEIGSTNLRKSVAGEAVFISKGNHFFKTVYQDSNGTVWTGGNEGLFRYNGTELINQDHLIGGKQAKIIHICGYQKNVILIATKSDGLIVLIHNGGQYHSHILPLKSNFVKDIFIDNNKVIWLATTTGILRLVFEQDGTYSQFIINHINGLLSDNIGSIEGIGDYIYAGTNEGLVKFNKHTLTAERAAPRVSIKWAKVNENLVELEQELELKPFNYDQNYIEFSYVAQSYTNTGNVDYRYKLTGVDSVWQHTKSRKVRYPSLVPGDYTFQVSASNQGGKWSQNKEVKFVINPPFWKTWWFILGIAILALFGLIFLFRMREKRNTREFAKLRQLEEQKGKIIEAKLIALRSQMNPHFTFNALTAIQNVMVNFTMKEAVNYMASFSDLMRRILENSEKLHISVDEEVKMLRLYVKLENLRFNNEIICDFIIDDSLNNDLIEIPSMIIQPFVENAFLHGLAPKKEGEKRIEIKIINQKDEIFCSVVDTGIGREASRIIGEKSAFKHHSLGLEITKKRLKLLDYGKDNPYPFQITDLYDEKGIAIGTSVEIRLKKRK